MISITKSQFYQLLGLVTASHHLEQKDISLYESFKEILKDTSFADDWFWEIRSSEQLESELKKRLKQEGIKILK